jgi:hypothetical protein
METDQRLYTPTNTLTQMESTSRSFLARIQKQDDAGPICTTRAPKAANSSPPSIRQQHQHCAEEGRSPSFHRWHTLLASPTEFGGAGIQGCLDMFSAHLLESAGSQS